MYFEMVLASLELVHDPEYWNGSVASGQTNYPIATHIESHLSPLEPTQLSNEAFLSNLES